MLRVSLCALACGVSLLGCRPARWLLPSIPSILRRRAEAPAALATEKARENPRNHYLKTMWNLGGGRIPQPAPPEAATRRIGAAHRQSSQARTAQLFSAPPPRIKGFEGRTDLKAR